MNKNYIIEIRVKDFEGILIVKKEALTFESAGENLGKLEKFIRKFDEACDKIKIDTGTKMDYLSMRESRF